MATLDLQVLNKAPGGDKVLFDPALQVPNTPIAKPGQQTVTQQAAAQQDTTQGVKISGALVKPAWSQTPDQARANPYTNSRAPWDRGGLNSGGPNSGGVIEGPLFSGTGPDSAYSYTGTAPVTAADGSTSDAALGITPSTSATDTAAAFIRKEENDGYSQTTAQWDVNAYRGGYGSDAYTKADGTVVKLSYRGQPVDKADAERDVQRRIPILNAQAAKEVGPAYAKLPGYVQGMLIPIVDNYGHLPAHVVAAARGGNLQMLGDAVAALGSDNGGIRAARYNRAANIIRGTGISNVGP